MNKIINLSFSVFIAAVWLFTSINPVLADSPNTPKEEVIYVNLNDDGSVQAVYAVNIFDINENETITDYGLYEWVRPLNTSDKIDQNGDINTIQAHPGRIYYEGAMGKTELPWNFNLRYFLDGKEYSAKEIAGQSGLLKITLTITQNTAASNNSYFEHYTLQVSLSLDTEKFQAIEAGGATQANAGKNKQLTYFILPGNEKEITISARVTDCEIPSLQINGISLDMDASRPDTEKMLNQVKDLREGIGDLDDGAVDIRDGTLELRDKAMEFQKGAQKLDDAINDLVEGARTLDDNVGDLRDGVKELKDGSDDLRSGSKALAAGIRDISDGAEELAGATQQIATGAAALQSGSATLADGAKALYQGSTVLTGSLTELSGASSSLAKGVSNLSSGLTTLDSSSPELTGASDQIGEGLRTTAEATAQLEAGSTNFVAYLNSLAQSNDPTVAMTAKGILDQYQPTLHAGIVQLNSNYNGSGDTLPEACDQFQTGLNQYCGSIEALTSGSSTLASGASQIASGTAAAAQGAGQLSENAGVLAAGAVQIDAGIDSLAAATTQLNTGMQIFYAGTATAVEYGNELNEGARKLNDGVMELDSGVDALKAAGTEELLNGAEKLKDGTTDLIEATDKLYDGSCELSDGSVAISLGTRELRDRTSDLDSQFSDKIDEIFDNITGGKWSPTSFVSEKNTKVKSVQFVIKTNGIEVEEITSDNTSTESDQGFWQRLWNVFSIKK